MNSVIIYLIVLTLILLVNGLRNNNNSYFNLLGISLAFLYEDNLIRLIILFSVLLVFFISELDNETTILMNTGVIGLLILSTAKELIIIYLALELVGLSFYVLAARERKGMKSTEAGMKYFVLGALSSGIFLLGISLVYAQTGTTDLELIDSTSSLFIVVGLLFKLGAAPFHMWVPDIYEGSATIITTYFAIVPKIAYLSLLMNINQGETYLMVGIISILVGSIGAINQTKIKRLLAFSAIGHVGFMLLGIGVATFAGIQATILYMIIYIIMTIQTFTVVISHKFEKLVEVNGISRRNPIIGITLGLGLMSIAGVPPLAGFVNKYIVILSVIEGQEILYGIIAILLSVISSFYYVRIIRFMFFVDKPTITSNPVIITTNQAIVLGITTYLIISLMFFPSILIEVAFPLTKAWWQSGLMRLSWKQ